MNETSAALRALIPVLNESRTARNLMEAFVRTLQLDLDGEDGTLYLVIAGGRMDVCSEMASAVDVRVVGDTREFARVVRGELDITHPIARGHVHVEEGKVSDMTLLTRILWSTKRGVA